VLLLVSVAGVLHGCRGRRTWLSTLILREMSQEQVRQRHVEMRQSLDAEGKLSQTDKVLQVYLPPAIGWAILLGFLAIVVVVMVYMATLE